MTCKDDKTENEILCELELSLSSSFILYGGNQMPYKEEEGLGEN